MDAIKPDQERVKNLLLDTVTLLCKNSLQYENYLRVEGLLGVAVDDNDTFFLHISERFQSDAYTERLNNEKEEKEAAARKREEEEKEEERQRELEKTNEIDNASREASESLAVKVKTEAREDASDGEDLIITGSSGLQSPQTVAQQASMVAGQRRAPRRPHSPSGGAHNRSHSESDFQTQNSPFVHSDSGDGSFSQYDSNQSIKAEDQWDGPPAKRQSMSNPWPNVTSMGELSLQAAQASFQDSDGQFAGGGGDLSQPGCSAWPTNIQQAGSQDSGLLLKELEPCLSPPWLGTSEGGGQKAGGSRSFECSHCGQGFPSTYRLKRHQLSHTGERPYRCSRCDATFSRLDHMKRHIANVHK